MDKMDKIIDYINNKLKIQGIESDFSSTIRDLINRKVINSNMSLKIGYNTFILYKSKDNLFFRAILEKNHVFDITILVENDNLEKVLENNKTIIDKNIKNQEKDIINNKFITSEEVNDIKNNEENNKSKFKIIKNDKSEIIQNLLEKTFEKKKKYIFVEKRSNLYFIGIKLNNEVYEPIKNVNLMPTLLPYYLLNKIFRNFKEINIQEKIYLIDKKNDVKTAFDEVMVKFKGTNGMVMVSTYDIQFSDTSIYNCYNVPVYLKNLKWPNNIVEGDLFREMAHSELFAKNEYREILEDEIIVFKHNNFYFKVQAFLQKNIKNKIIEAVENNVKKEGENFWRKIRMIKYILGVIGAYPILINDLMIDSIALCLCKNICGDGKFIKKFFEFDFDMKSMLLDVNKKIIMKDQTIDKSLMKIIFGDISYNIIIPNDEQIAEIVYKLDLFNKIDEKIFVNEKNEEINNILKLFGIKEEKGLVYNLNCKEVIEYNFSDYDFVLSKKKVSDKFEKIIYKEDEIFHKFDRLKIPLLGTYNLENTVLNNYNNQILAFFSPINDCLYVKVNDIINLDLLVNIIILETNFNYIKFKTE